MMDQVQRALEKQQKMEAEATDGPWPYLRDDWEWRLNAADSILIVHLRNQAKLAKDVIKVAMIAADDVCGMLQGFGVEGDQKTCRCIPHMIKRALIAWADHVNEEPTTVQAMGLPMADGSGEGAMSKAEYLSGDGDGSGDGDAFGDGSGRGDGNGKGDDYGREGFGLNGFGNGEGWSEGWGSGAGDGAGGGYGDGSGDGKGDGYD